MEYLAGMLNAVPGGRLVDLHAAYRIRRMLDGRMLDRRRLGRMVAMRRFDLVHCCASRGSTDRVDA
jgi:hypothetical protein